MSVRTASARRRARVLRLLAVVTLLAAFLAIPSVADALPACNRSYSVCLYRHADYRDVIYSSSPLSGRQNLAVRDQATSWWNADDRDWCAYDKRTGRRDQFLFRLYSDSNNPNVGADANDRADYLDPC